MISTVARLIAPARADTPIARPSAKLCTPIAAAIVRPDPERSPAGGVDLERERVGLGAADRGRLGATGDRGLGRRRRAHPPLDHRQPGAARGEPDGEQEHQPDHVGKRPPIVLERVQRVVDDRDPVRHDVDEDERQHADREHRERHPRPAAQQLQATDR